MREPINNSKEIPQKTSLQNNSKLINGFNENNINSENNNYSNNCQNNTKFSFKESGSNPAKQTRRPLTAQQKSPYISNFWISVRLSKLGYVVDPDFM
ncbi:unnamed protein product [Meloidogyne enterolobii]|uniref:Uncharacterized protein n=1 Tax=Meloidogyne enterolobii TaxID=390850 RepID=A0ACB0YDL4_MELEN